MINYIPLSKEFDENGLVLTLITCKQQAPCARWKLARIRCSFVSVLTKGNVMTTLRSYSFFVCVWRKRKTYFNLGSVHHHSLEAYAIYLRERFKRRCFFEHGRRSTRPTVMYGEIKGKQLTKELI